MMRRFVLACVLLLAVAAFAQTPKRIRVGAKVAASKLITKTEAVYPGKGRVTFSALIGKDGKVAKVEFLSGDSRLVEAAKAAVMQWVYSPMEIQGEAVEVETTIEVEVKPSKK